MRWVLRLIATGDDARCLGTDLVEICRPESLGDIANLGLALPEAKQLLESVQRASVTGQVDSHGQLRPCCRSCGGRCHLKDCRGALRRNSVRQNDGAAPPVSVYCLQSHRDGRASLSLHSGNIMRLARKVNELDQAEGAILAALRGLHEARDFLRLVLRTDDPVAAADASGLLPDVDRTISLLSRTLATATSLPRPSARTHSGKRLRPP